MTNPLQWGWKVGCAHPGCNNILEEWSEEGTPGLPHWRDTDVQGWYWRAVVQRDDEGQPVHRAYRAVYDYWAYCPEHAAPALDYEKNLSAWKDDRHAVGKTASQQFPGLLGKLGRLLMQRAVAPTMEEWELEHPRPIPPWQDTP